MQMHGWTVSNARGNVYHFGRYTFASRSYLRIHTGRGQNTMRDPYWSRSGSAWNYRGDTVILRSPSGAIVQRFHYKGGGSVA